MYIQILVISDKNIDIKTILEIRNWDDFQNMEQQTEYQT